MDYLKKDFKNLLKLKEGEGSRQLPENFKVKLLGDLITKLEKKAGKTEMYFLDKKTFCLIPLENFKKAEETKTLLQFLEDQKAQENVLSLFKDTETLSDKKITPETVPLVLKNLSNQGDTKRVLCITSVYKDLKEANQEWLNVTGKLAIDSLLKSKIKVEKNFPAKLFKGQNNLSLKKAPIERLLKKFSEQDLSYEASEVEVFLKTFLEKTKETFKSLPEKNGQIISTGKELLEGLKDNIKVSNQNSILSFELKTQDKQGVAYKDYIDALYTATPTQAEGVEAFLIGLANYIEPEINLFSLGGVPDLIIFPKAQNYPIADFLILPKKVLEKEGKEVEEIQDKATTFISCKKGDSGNRNIQAMSYFRSNLETIKNVLLSKAKEKEGSALELTEGDLQALKGILYKEREKASPMDICESLETSSKRNPKLPTKLLYDFFSKTDWKKSNMKSLVEYFSNLLLRIEKSEPNFDPNLNSNLNFLNEVKSLETLRDNCGKIDFLKPGFYLGGIIVKEDPKKGTSSYRPEPCLSYLEILISKALDLVNLSDILVSLIAKDLQKNWGLYKGFLEGSGLRFQKLNIETNTKGPEMNEEELKKVLQGLLDTFSIDITNSNTNGSLKEVTLEVRGKTESDEVTTFRVLAGKRSGVIFKGKGKGKGNGDGKALGHFYKNFIQNLKKDSAQTLEK